MIHQSPEIAPEWESPDVSALREFLNTTTGGKLFPALSALRPRLAGTTAESVALRAKLVEGYELAYNTLAALAYPARDAQEDSEPPTYPGLEDEQHWAGVQPK